MQRNNPNQIDVAIVGGGPAGLQAALVLARTRKRVIVFDDPAPPRNAASHGVHNFVGLDGLLPQQIRDRAWEQIDVYGSAQLMSDRVSAITRAPDSNDLVVETSAATWTARHVVLTCGYHDVLPDIDGFAQCWADTIIPCPFCDGYENRDRVWGIVPLMSYELDVFPSMVQNWTSERVVIVPRHIEVSEAQRSMLDQLGVPLHLGDIVAIDHRDGKLVAVTLDSGVTVEVATLLYSPPEQPAPLVSGLVDSLGLKLDEHGYVAVNQSQQTNVDGLWAAGDVQGWMGGIESAAAGGMAASMIVHDWYRSGAETA